jgi:hypothetical protein
MTVHLISVGLSMLDALDDPGRKLAAKRDLIAGIGKQRPGCLLADEGIDDTGREAASEWMVSALTPGTPQADRLRDVLAAVRPDQWPRGISAEIETFDRVPQGTGLPLREQDIAILVCSDTPRGLLAGMWNALKLTDGDASRVRYLPSPSTPLGAVRRNAVLVRVPGMDAGSPKGFREAMGGLGLLAGNLFGSRQLTKAEEFRFYLSGGFKAAIPYLIGLAEAVRSMDKVRLGQLGVPDLMPERGPYPVRAFVLHETAGPGAPAIELPLRMLIADAVREELTGFGASRKPAGIPGYGMLNGYAYEATGRPGREVCELTAFGEGLRALFGVADI